MPAGGFYFDNLERQQEIDEDNMDLPKIWRNILKYLKLRLHIIVQKLRNTVAANVLLYLIRVVRHSGMHHNRRTWS